MKVLIKTPMLLSRLFSGYKRRDSEYLTRRFFLLVLQKLSVRVYYPNTIEIETTTRCNLNCKMCDHSWRVDKKGNMSFENFKNIIDQFKFPYYWSTAPRTRMINDNFGNYLKHEFKELWNSEKSKKFKNDVCCSIVPQVCCNCQVYGQV